MEPAVFSKMASKTVTRPVISTNKLPIKQGNETPIKLFGGGTAKRFECFFINLSLNLYAVYLDQSTHNEIGSLGITIVNINYSFALTCIHASLFGIVSLKWKGIVSFLQDIEKLGFFRFEDYRKFRKICVIGGFINIFMVKFLNYFHNVF